MRKLRDLGLSYDAALHGLQTAILHDMFTQERGMAKEVGEQFIDPARYRTDDKHRCGPKHLKVGHDARASDHMGLVSLLIEKGVISEEEYIERMRLALNDELAGREEQYPGVKFR